MPATKNDEQTALTAQNTNTSMISNQSGLLIDTSDIEIPRVNVVQKISDIDAPTGSLVLDKKHVLLKPQQIGKAVIVNAIKGWKEDVPFDSDVIPRIAMTAERKEQLAAESDYAILEFADIVFLLEQPEDNDNEKAFAFPIGDLNYALAKLYVAKDAYRQTFKRLATFAAFNRETPVQSRVWDFQTQLMEKGKYSWWVPSFATTTVETPEDVTSFLKSFTA
jgi:hypothetical protein